MSRRTTPYLTEAVAAYLRVRSTHVASTTQANDQALLRKFVRSVGDRQTHLLTAELVEDWMAVEAVRQQSPSPGAGP